MKFKELIVDDKSITSKRKINRILESNKLNWLIDAEVDDVIVEIKNDTVIWHDGVWYYGVWEYGIWKNGEFRSGIWKSGIFESGIFRGKFKSGKVIDGNINGEDIKDIIFNKK